jgi:hypothetical protein
MTGEVLTSTSVFRRFSAANVTSRPWPIGCEAKASATKYERRRSSLRSSSNWDVDQRACRAIDFHETCAVA